MNAKTGTGSAPSWSGTIDAATNRLTNASFDANGNQTNVPLIAGSEMPDALSSMVYDVSNRLIRAENNGATRRGEYDYDPGNKRIWEKRSVNGVPNGEWAYFFGITGQRMGRYTFTVSGSAITFAQSQASVWFGGKLVQKLDGASVSYPGTDRLFSVGRYLPYGEAKPGSSNPAGDNEKFATYTRDAGTGLDYADQRWFIAGTARFLTSDPYEASGGAGDPGSWNRFGYVGGDPVGRFDVRGLEEQDVTFTVDVFAKLPEALTPYQEMLIGTYRRSQRTLQEMDAAPNSPQDGPAFAARRTTAQMQSRVVQAFASLSTSCLDLLKSKNPFGSIAPNLLQLSIQAAGTANFVDASSDAQWLRLRASEVAGASIPASLPPDMTVGEYATAIRQVDEKEKGVTFAARVGQAVILMPAFYKDYGSQDRTLIHEVLHIGSNMGDVQLAQLLGIDTTGMSEGKASEAIDDFLKNDCKKKDK
jgi:RHS repeat-associated protein